MTTDLPTEFPVYYIADDQRVFMIPTSEAFDRFIAEVRLDLGLTVQEILTKYPLFSSFEDAETAGGHD